MKANIRKAFIIIAVILVIIVLAIIGYNSYRNNSSSKQSSDSSASVSDTEKPTEETAAQPDKKNSCGIFLLVGQYRKNS